MTYDFSTEETEDIQHDMAVVIAGRDEFTDMLEQMTEELQRRGAALPVNCRYVVDSTALFGRRLEYDVQ